MRVTVDGIFISDNDEHSLNVLFSIIVIEGGIENAQSDVHFSKAESPIKSTHEGIEISASDVHSLKLLAQIFVTDVGIVIFFSDVQDSKVDSSIFVIVKGMNISVILLHPLKEDGPISILSSDNKRFIISILFFFAARCNAVK